MNTAGRMTRLAHTSGVGTLPVSKAEDSHGHPLPLWVKSKPMGAASKYLWSARNAGRTSMFIFYAVLAVSALRGLVTGAKETGAQADWKLELQFSFYVGVACFVALFLFNLVAAVRAQPALDILSTRFIRTDLTEPPFSGFVAAEYYWLVMNRTYLIFIAPEGLYGWQAQGPFAASNSTYFEPYRRMLDDEEFMRDRIAIKKLSELRGGFFLDRSQIASIVSDDRGEWGMAGIPHSGRIRVRLVSGESREFIILGAAHPYRVRDKIASEYGLK
jgi:hypothetical protein